MAQDGTHVASLIVKCDRPIADQPMSSSSSSLVAELQENVRKAKRRREESEEVARKRRGLELRQLADTQVQLFLDVFTSTGFSLPTLMIRESKKGRPGLHIDLYTHLSNMVAEYNTKYPKDTWTLHFSGDDAAVIRHIASCDGKKQDIVEELLRAKLGVKCWLGGSINHRKLCLSWSEKKKDKQKPPPEKESEEDIPCTDLPRFGYAAPRYSLPPHSSSSPS